MKGWKEVELNEVAPYWVEKIDASELDETNFISADNMKTDKGGIVNSDYVPKSGKSTHFERNDILISNIRPYFKKIWFAKFDGGCSNDVIVFRTNRKIADSKFIYYSLAKDDFFDYMMAGANGTKMPRGNKKSIPMYKINLPPLPTQRKIAEILSAYDDLIENNLKRIKLLEEKVQLTYEEWFVRMKFPGHETTPINEKTGLPEGWKRVKLNEVLKFNQGVQVSIENQHKEKTSNRVRFIRIVDVTQGGQEKRFIELPRDNQIVKHKDIFMVRYGAPQVVTNFNGAIANNFFKINIIDKNRVFAKYVYSFLDRKEIKDYLMGVSVSATMPAISFKSFGQIVMILPDNKLQEKFHEYADYIFELILNLNFQNAALNEARDILLPRLMTGMIDVDKLKGVS
jgi:type I restriction enzyme S subunit